MKNNNQTKITSTIYQKKRVFEYIVRELPIYCKSLSAYEQNLLIWIADRTVSYGKTEEKISIKDFTTGVFSRDKNKNKCLVQYRVLMSKTTLLRAIKSLEQKEILIVKRDDNSNKSKNYYGINFQHKCFNSLSDFIQNNNCKTIMQNIVQDDDICTQNGSTVVDQDCSSEEPDVVRQKDNNIYNHNKVTETKEETESKEISSQASRDSYLHSSFQIEKIEKVEEIEKVEKNDNSFVDNVISGLEKRRESAIHKKNDNKLLNGPLSTPLIIKAWKESVSKTDYAMKIDLTITKAEAGRVKIGLLPMLVEYFIETHGSGTIPQYFDWITQNWGLIMRTKFKWMNKETPPMQPNIMFLTNFKKYFMDAYYAQNQLRKIDNGTISGTLMADLLKKGYSYKEIIENSLLQEAINRKKYDAEQLLKKAEKTMKAADVALITAENEAIDQVGAAISDYKTARWNRIRDALISSAHEHAMKNRIEIDGKKLKEDADKTIEELMAEFEENFKNADFNNYGKKR